MSEKAYCMVAEDASSLACASLIAKNRALVSIFPALESSVDSSANATIISLFLFLRVWMRDV